MAKKSDVEFINSLKTNAEVLKQVVPFEPTIRNTYRSYAGREDIGNHLEDDVVDAVYKKFVTRKAVYDPSKGSMEAFVHKIALNCTKDVVRSIHEQYYDATQAERGDSDDQSESATLDAEIKRSLAENAYNFDYYGFSKEEKSLFTKQALIRLFRVSGNKHHIEMFVRRSLFEEPVNQIAEEFGERPSNVSLICTTRLLPEFKKIIRHLWHDDEDGKLEILDERALSFLDKYLKDL